MKHGLLVLLGMMCGLGIVIALRSKGEQPPEPDPVIVLAAPVEFTVSQRTTTPLPGSNGKMVIILGDITGGQVMTTLSSEDGWSVSTLLEPDHVLGCGNAKLKLVELSNALVGEDKATFLLWAAADAETNALTEDEKIEALILALKQLVGAKFIRNGKAHTVDEAIEHMRTKWEWKKSEIKTAEDFIRVAASQSSVSGDPYFIRFADGTQRQAGEWFRAQLDEKPGD
jgi:Family of unknown function (DUF5329)